MRLRCVALRVCRRVPAVRDRIRTGSQVLSDPFDIPPDEYQFNQEISNLDGNSSDQFILLQSRSMDVCSEQEQDHIH